MNIINPLLILDRNVCLNNISMMAEKARAHNLIFRPHFKTHQSATVGEWFRSEGVSAITVSSLAMAQYFARHHWNDITLAFPLNPSWIPDINNMSANVRLNLLTDQPSTAELLDKLINPHAFYIKIDNGYGRAGLPAADHERIFALADALHNHPKHSFKGILIHQGDNYHHNSKEALVEAHKENIEKLLPLITKMKLRYPHAICSWGDTPSCSTVNDFSGIDEIRPGNFVFNDLMQLTAGVCDAGQIALTLAAPVVAVYPDRGKMILQAGAVHLSKESIRRPGSPDCYGLITAMEGLHRREIIPGLQFSALSQEHGIVTGPESLISRFAPGDVVGVIPVHACLTADLMKGYITADGDRVAMMPAVTAIQD